MKAFWLAFQFLTVIRLPGKFEFTKSDFLRSLRWFFAPGLMIGALQWVVACTSVHFQYSTHPAAPVIVITGILLTGGLHLDGVDVWMARRRSRKRLSTTRRLANAVARSGSQASAALVSQTGISGHIGLAFLLVPHFFFQT